MSNAETVQQIYAAFGEGNISAILSHLADDVDWEYGQGPNDVPWLQPRRGRDAVGAFFEALQGMEMHKFAPTRVIDGGDVVIALIDVEFTVKATGQRVSERDEMHLWRFNADGKVAGMRHGVDTLTHQRAVGG
jgi:ketosteroid isomerase-like protein